MAAIDRASKNLENAVFFNFVGKIAGKQSFPGWDKGWFSFFDFDQRSRRALVLPLFTAFAKPVFIAANFFQQFGTTSLKGGEAFLISKFGFILVVGICGRTTAFALWCDAKFPAELRDQAIEMVQALWKVYVEEDATLVEVNPLARLEGDKLEALDGKVSLDENAEFRHEDHAAFEIREEADPLEAKAKDKGLNYVKLDGAVGIIGNGAGLVMSTLDVVAYAGEGHGGVKPANFLDIGGGANAKVMADGLDVILNDPQVKSVFVNVFGGITACDEVANGIVGALEILGSEASKPLVVRLDGNNVEEGRRILNEANHPLVTLVDTMDGAADKAAELANA